jgi:hypothetical protein
LVTWQVFRITTKKIIINMHIAKSCDDAIHTRCITFELPTCNLYLEYNPRFSVAPFQVTRKGLLQSSNFTFLTKRYNVVLSTRITQCTIAVDTKSFPAPVSNVSCSKHPVRSLLRQPRSALEAGPSEARAISFVHTPRPHLHL